ncbi:MAG: pentapeptide repeat-containing protein [Bdellovibrionales bacterium]|nr:pentapeptide repeat-containing protein [Bdellovibrionales bacterium]
MENPQLYESSSQKPVILDGIQKQDLISLNRIEGSSNPVAALGCHWLNMNLINTQLRGGFFIDSKISASYLNQVVFSHMAFRGVSFDSLQMDKVRFESCFFASCRFHELQLLHGPSDVLFVDCVFENTQVPLGSVQQACALYGSTTPTEDIGVGKTEKTKKPGKIPAPSDSLERIAEAGRFGGLEL